MPQCFLACVCVSKRVGVCLGEEGEEEEGSKEVSAYYYSAEQRLAGPGDMDMGMEPLEMDMEQGRRETEASHSVKGSLEMEFGSNTGLEVNHLHIRIPGLCHSRACLDISAYPC